MKQTCKLVVGRVVEVTEFLVSHGSLNSQPVGDVRFNVHVERGVILLC